MDDINTLIEGLVALGEDRDELELWESIYPSLEAEEKSALIENLQEELRELSEQKG